MVNTVTELCPVLCCTAAFSTFSSADEGSVLFMLSGVSAGYALEISVLL